MYLFEPVPRQTCGAPGHPAKHEHQQPQKQGLGHVEPENHQRRGDHGRNETRHGPDGDVWNIPIRMSAEAGNDNRTGLILEFGNGLAVEHDLCFDKVSIVQHFERQIAGSDGLQMLLDSWVKRRKLRLTLKPPGAVTRIRHMNSHFIGVEIAKLVHDAGRLEFCFNEPVYIRFRHVRPALKLLDLLSFQRLASLGPLVSDLSLKLFQTRYITL